jgi:ABC-type Fe3+ transport system permease subunit
MYQCAEVNDMGKFLMGVLSGSLFGGATTLLLTAAYVRFGIQADPTEITRLAISALAISAITGLLYKFIPTSKKQSFSRPRKWH